jgi:peroxiredoxin
MEVENPSLARQFRVMMSQGLFQTLTLQVSVATELKDFERAESAVERMREYLDTHGDHQEDRPRLEHWYLTNAANLANSEGRKPDALLFYSKAFQRYPADPSPEARAHQLWMQLGGTQEGFNTWKLTIAQMNRVPDGTNSSSSPWTPMNTPLTTFHATDINGRTWTHEDLKGRTTLVSIWATWCRPCQEELPAVQNMFDEWKGRRDVQLLTVSVDEDLSLARKFAEQKHFTFPIVGMTAASIDKLMGIEGVPRTWIVDSTGTVQFELIGYDRALWPKQILQQLDALK